MASSSTLAVSAADCGEAGAAARGLPLLVEQVVVAVPHAVADAPLVGVRIAPALNVAVRIAQREEHDRDALGRQGFDLVQARSDRVGRRGLFSVDAGEEPEGRALRLRAKHADGQAVVHIDGLDGPTILRRQPIVGAVESLDRKPPIRRECRDCAVGVGSRDRRPNRDKRKEGERRRAPHSSIFPIDRWMGLAARNMDKPAVKDIAAISTKKALFGIFSQKVPT